MRRESYRQLIKEAFKIQPVVAVLGPRQVGKTTLARTFNKDLDVSYFDLEDSRDLAKLDNPMLMLERLQGLIIIDEIQLRPNLFPALRVLVDNPSLDQRYLILGSASRDLIRQSSETLAGRIHYLDLPPFTLAEVRDLEKLWVRGGFPKSYLSESDAASLVWRQDYIQTFLERDIPNLGFQVPPRTMQRFWSMLSHYHGQTLNMSELGTSLGVSNTAIRNYLGILTGTFMIRELTSWFAHNLKKRQVKAPKLYFRDSGILNALAGIHTYDHLLGNPKIGAYWEGFALEQVICARRVRPESCYYWRTHAGAELDLLIDDFGIRVGFEFKYTEAPKLTKSMQVAVKDLELPQLYVIYPGNDEYPLSDNITAVGLQRYLKTCSL
ncbi:MAG: ATP-binding protein [Pseudomonadota bacterium]